MPPAAIILAESESSSPESAILPSIIVIVLVIALFGFIKWFRRKIRQPDTETPGGFTLGDLRNLVKAGKMTPEEYERAKELILGANKRAIDIKPPQETISNKRIPPLV